MCNKRQIILILLCCIAASFCAMAQDTKPAKPHQKSEPPRLRSVDPKAQRVRPAPSPLSPEEANFVKALSDKLKHVLVVVAANPQVSYPSGSLPERIRQVYLRLAKGSQAAEIQKRAQARLTAGPDVRKRLFGEFADPASDARLRDSKPGLDQELKTKLQAAMKARLGRQADLNREAFRDAVRASQLTDRPTRAASPKAIEMFGQNLTKYKMLAEPRTWVETGVFTGEFPTDGTKKVTIHELAAMDFRWWTVETEADYGQWRLLKGGFSPDHMLAQGNAGIAPSIPGGKRPFTIDLKNWLPGQPPAKPTTYYVQVQAQKKPQLGSKSTGAMAIGAWSQPVVITYLASTVPPTTFETVDIYNELIFYLDKIHMVEDQYGPGGEEFYIESYLTQHTADSHSAQYKVGSLQADLDPDGPRDKAFGAHVTVGLQPPDSPLYPRTFTALFSIMEEDDGGSVGAWQSAISNEVDEIVSDGVTKEIASYLEDQIEQDINTYLNYGVNVATHIAEVVCAIIGGAGGAIGGMAVAAIGLTVADIIADKGDDYYGTQVAVFFLPTNMVPYFNDVPGTFKPDGSFSMKPEVLLFRGEAGYPAAVSWDGEVELQFHYEFRKRTSWPF